MPGSVLPSNRYTKPRGYNVSPAPAGYKPFNGYLGGTKAYGPVAVTAQKVVYTFSAKPDDNSDLTIQDSQFSVSTFTFLYGGSAGPGNIPLVVGGGTAAQAAAATALALQAQLDEWTVTSPTATSVQLVRKEVGSNYSAAREDVTHIGLANSSGVAGGVLPARFGKNYGWLSAGPLPDEQG